MLDPTTRTALEPVILLFDRLRVDYFIAGSLASAAYGEPRTTLDADFVVALEESHAEAISAALREGYYLDPAQVRDAIRHRSSFNLVSLATSFKVDVFVRPDTPYSLEQFARRRRLKIGSDPDLFAWFASAEDVLLSKLEWFRRGGEVSDRQWRDVLGILKVQGDSLDYAYLSKWGEVLGVADLLRRARSEAEVP